MAAYPEFSLEEVADEVMGEEGAVSYTISVSIVLNMYKVQLL